MPTESTGSESSALKAGVTGWSRTLHAGRSSIVPGDWQIASFHGMSDTLLKAGEGRKCPDTSRRPHWPTVREVNGARLAASARIVRKTGRPLAAGDAAMSTVRSGPSSGSRRPDDCARRIPTANIAHRRFGGLVAVTVCGAVACSSPGFPVPMVVRRGAWPWRGLRRRQWLWRMSLELPYTEWVRRRAGENPKRLQRFWWRQDWIRRQFKRRSLRKMWSAPWRLSGQQGPRSHWATLRQPTAWRT